MLARLIHLAGTKQYLWHDEVSPLDFDSPKIPSHAVHLRFLVVSVWNTN
jgi:hypothetical protein